MAWEEVVREALWLLAHRRISPEQAESWIWTLMEFAETE